MKYLSVKGIVAGVIAVVIAAVCIRLGFWQLDRLESRRARNEEVAAAMAAPRLPLDSAAVAAIGADPGRFQYRPVRVTGVWDETGRFLLRARGRLGAPGVHLVTPLLLPGVERALQVDRGWIPSPDAATADPRPFRPPGTVTISGTIELPAIHDDKEAMARFFHVLDWTSGRFELTATTVDAADVIELRTSFVLLEHARHSDEQNR